MRKIQKTLGITAGILCIAGSGSAFAGSVEMEALKQQMQQIISQNHELTRQNLELKERISHIEQAMEAQEKIVSVENGSEATEGRSWYDRVTFGGGVTGIVQASANNGENNPDGGNVADASMTFDLMIEADLDGYGMLNVHLEGGEGEGMNNNVPSFSVPNYDAYATWNNENQETLTVSEAFYSNTFWNDRMEFDLGKMDISVLFDENTVAGDETTQFFSNIFVKSMGLTIPEPDEFYCPATMIAVSPAEFVEFRVIGAAVDNEEGHTWDNIFSHNFVTAQVNFRPNFLEHQGNFRFYGWYDGRRHLKNEFLAGANNTPLRRYQDADSGQHGWGLSFDQDIMDGLTAFTRYSWSQDDLSVWDQAEKQWAMIPFNQVYSMGIGISGLHWNRPDDGIGLAFGQTILTSDFENSEHAEGISTSNEKYVETWYRYTFNRYLALSADFQWVQNPGGLDNADDVYLFGVRSQIDF